MAKRKPIPRHERELVAHCEIGDKIEITAGPLLAKRFTVTAFISRGVFGRQRAGGVEQEIEELPGDAGVRLLLIDEEL